MRSPSPCPRCRSTRTWDDLTSEPASPVRAVTCHQCGRHATACPRCGWEFTGAQRTSAAGAAAPCVSCVMIGLVGRRMTAGDDRLLPHWFGATGADPGIDDLERDVLVRYGALRQFAAAALDADRRAASLARLEMALARLACAPPAA